MKLLTKFKKNISNLQIKIKKFLIIFLLCKVHLKVQTMEKKNHNITVKTIIHNNYNFNKSILRKMKMMNLKLSN